MFFLVQNIGSIITECFTVCIIQFIIMVVFFVAAFLIGNILFFKKFEYKIYSFFSCMGSGFSNCSPRDGQWPLLFLMALNVNEHYNLRFSSQNES